MKTQVGQIRFVNPERPPSFITEIIGEDGRRLSARTRLFHSFAFYVIKGGVEFYCGREFRRDELLQFTRKVFAHPQQTQHDQFGNIPATGWEDPRRWTWRGFTQGEVHLDREFRPTAKDLAELSALALNELEPGRTYPQLDDWECWVCDKDSLEPIALVLTALDQESIESLTYSPMVRLGRGDYSFDFEDHSTARALRDRINERINTATAPGRFGYFARIFRREIDGSALEVFPRRYCNGQWTEERPPTERPAGYLPAGLFAEPFESAYRALKRISADPDDEWPNEIGE